MIIQTRIDNSMRITNNLWFHDIEICRVRILHRKLWRKPETIIIDQSCDWRGSPSRFILPSSIRNDIWIQSFEANIIDWCAVRLRIILLRNRVRILCRIGCIFIIMMMPALNWISSCYYSWSIKKLQWHHLHWHYIKTKNRREWLYL